MTGGEVVMREEKTMTVKEVAKALGVSYSSVDRAITKLFPNRKGNGKATLLSEAEVACISKELKGHHNLFATEKVKSTTTELEVLANAAAALSALQELYTRKEAEYKAIIADKDARIAAQQPKVDFYDAVTGSDKVADMGTVSKVLNVPGYGRTSLFRFLREQKILQKNNQPYQEYVDAGYFRLVECSYTLPNGDAQVYFKAVVLQKGLDFIRRLLDEKGRGAA